MERNSQDFQNCLELFIILGVSSVEGYLLSRIPLYDGDHIHSITYIVSMKRVIEMHNRSVEGFYMRL